MRYFLLFCSAGLLFGQGTETKRTPEEYEVHAQARGAAIGAEFTIHSFSNGDASYLANDFLVVEVALFPSKGTEFAVKYGSFALRVNGKTQLLFPESPALVASNLEHPEWKQANSPHLEGGGSLGNAGVILGAPQRRSNPDGPTPTGVPKTDPYGVKKAPRVSAEELVVQVALVEGPHQGAFSGFLYFPFQGKIKSIKTLELLYNDTVLKLR